MSIFPKRTVAGKGVTIHWNFNISHLKKGHVFPFVRIGVQWPNGQVTMLMEECILGFANPRDEDVLLNEDGKKFKYLKKNTPFLVLNDYLSGVIKREALANIISGIESGRHYYFQFALPKKAPPGKYTLISEVYNNGEKRYSKTKEDDFFFVDNIEKRATKKNDNGYVSIIKNNSTEATPIKIVECFESGNKVKCMLLSPLSASEIHTISSNCFLLYNEEREVIALNENNSPFVIKNHQYIPLKREDRTYVMSNSTEDIYELTELQAKIRERADGITLKNRIVNITNNDSYNELVDSGIILENKF
ncbi:hypothetical protein [Pseudofulvibacter geojedonensis]|uniref:Uncharacterized protein n=1 Tax=Pseudofulvibacter geojedonensis TaxID=1123758 RepID=A0ABW3I2S3_9FLAO